MRAQKNTRLIGRSAEDSNMIFVEKFLAPKKKGAINGVRAYRKSDAIFSFHLTSSPQGTLCVRHYLIVFYNL